MGNSKVMEQQSTAKPPGSSHAKVQARDKRPKIYVCSPYRLTSLTPEDMEREKAENEDRVQMACWLITQLNAIPYAAHGYFTHFLDDADPFERELGMRLGLEWLEECDELWVFGERVSDGMAKEIAYAKERGIPVLCKPEPQELMERLLVELKMRYGERDNEGEAGNGDNEGSEIGADVAERDTEMEEQNGKNGKDD